MNDYCMYMIIRFYILYTIAVLISCGSSLRQQHIAQFKRALEISKTSVYSKLTDNDDDDNIM